MGWQQALRANGQALVAFGGLGVDDDETAIMADAKVALHWVRRRAFRTSLGLSHRGLLGSAHGGASRKRLRTVRPWRIAARLGLPTSELASIESRAPLAERRRVRAALARVLDAAVL